MLKLAPKDMAVIATIVSEYMLKREQEQKLLEAAALLRQNKYVTAKMYGMLDAIATQLGLPAFEDDNIRFLQMGLLAREIEAKQLQGSIAELGVFRGNFSRYIRRAFPGRKYYLFDTFECFDKEQAQHDAQNTTPSVRTSATLLWKLLSLPLAMCSIVLSKRAFSRTRPPMWTIHSCLCPLTWICISPRVTA